MRPGRLGTLVAAISVWLASHNGRLATVPRCPWSPFAIILLAVLAVKVIGAVR
eukprot:COSAG06_NODE_3998_length_4675_cov_11.970935_1_plen_53_part_00